MSDPKVVLVANDVVPGMGLPVAAPGLRVFGLGEGLRRHGFEVVTAVDPGGETGDWRGRVGLVPAVLQDLAPSAEDAVAVVCGPPIMIKFTLPVLDELGFPAGNVYTTLENRMKCGVGKCGRCNVGRVYVCKDGPVFTAAELRALPNDF